MDLKQKRLPTETKPFHLSQKLNGEVDNTLLYNETRQVVTVFFEVFLRVPLVRTGRTLEFCFSF